MKHNHGNWAKNRIHIVFLHLPDKNRNFNYMKIKLFPNHDENIFISKGHMFVA